MALAARAALEAVAGEHVVDPRVREPREPRIGEHELDIVGERPAPLKLVLFDAVLFQASEQIHVSPPNDLPREGAPWDGTRGLAAVSEGLDARGDQNGSDGAGHGCVTMRAGRGATETAISGPRRSRRGAGAAARARGAAG